MSESQGSDRLDRSMVIGAGLARVSTWSLRLLLVAGGVIVLGVLIGQLWMIVLPVFLAVILATVLWPLTAWLRRRFFPPAAAALTVMLGALTVLGALFAVLVPLVAGQVDEITTSASGGLQQIEDWLSESPLDLGRDQIDSALGEVIDRLQDSATAIISGVLTGVSAIASGLLTAALALVLAFFFVKDGPRFLPWLRRVVGMRAGRHLDDVLNRAWNALGSFIRTQALVSLVDAVFIGIGLVLLGVPLAFPLAVLTFFGGFVPIVGAFVAGALSVLVALVSEGLTTALIVLGIIIVVQQLESNVLQPILQGRSLRLHPTVVLLAVVAGGSLFGLAGAFLAVPIVAVMAEVLRYLGEHIDAATGAADTGPETEDADRDTTSKFPVVS
ncbi:MAG: AI-2E family transporter [Actinomycetota bacterium]|nr:AI-2E family transporter [Actinomycetota bacterium]